ncbi:hypothetical protein DFH07DRAFT_737041 [Mycena maculata]|uniref:Uncharacterized protein n=1 Tax=Mycena maculata TaxID=230809 RepID=A0AAD7JNW2_9AGAR|nr:hypothetical protein DFH07DRAFT_737041 [Mycena maculata]
MARHGRLEANLNDAKLRESVDPVQQLAAILQPDDDSDSRTPSKPLNASEVANILGRGTDLSTWDYDNILGYLQSNGQPWRANKAIPHPVGALILPPRGISKPRHTIDHRIFSCQKVNEGSSAIQFHNPSANLGLTTGYIRRIWQLPLQGHMQTFLVVETHKKLSLSDQWKAPFYSMPYLYATIVDAAPSGEFLIIEPRHIITHLAVYKRPAGTYKIKQAILVISWALNRGRRQ